MALYRHVGPTRLNHNPPQSLYLGGLRHELVSLGSGSGVHLRSPQVLSLFFCPEDNHNTVGGP